MIHNNYSNISRVTALTLGLFGVCAAVQATENGAPTTAVGVYDFGAGMMPPATPFGTLGLRTFYFSSNVQKDRQGAPWIIIFPWMCCRSVSLTCA